MLGKIARLAQTFLSETTVGDAKDAFEILNTLIEELEVKEDPDPIEVRLIANLYNFVEHLEIMRKNLTSYVTDSQNLSPGSTLGRLYESESIDGFKNLKD